MIFAENFARNYEKNGAWNIRHLFHDLFVPVIQRHSDHVYYNEDCRIPKEAKSAVFFDRNSNQNSFSLFGLATNIDFSCFQK